MFALFSIEERHTALKIAVTRVLVPMLQTSMIDWIAILTRRIISASWTMSKRKVKYLEKLSRSKGC
jgi:hypothetical protein